MSIRNESCRRRDGNEGELGRVYMLLCWADGEAKTLNESQESITIAIVAIHGIVLRETQ